MLIHFGVTPYLVFDGDYLPGKAATEVERAKKRDDSRRSGLELYRVGKPAQAQKELQKAVDVTPEMAGQLISELKKLGVQYVVAPYEADAQLAYLERKGIIQGVLSEDSDLLVFGVKCLLTKLDQYGDCVEINRKDFTACRDISLVGWSDAEFRLMAVLSGCDYLPSITNMGLLTAYRMVRKHKTVDKILRMLQFDGKYYVPTGYQEAIENAIITFRHQRVFCPLSRRLEMVTNPDIELKAENLAFIGAPMESEIAVKVAYGDLHPMTKKPFKNLGLGSGIPRTPLSNVSKPNAVKFTDLKENKSIESFFKAKRTPLAELDPNSFRLSPSQQRLQQRVSGGWMSSPTPYAPSASSSNGAGQLVTTPQIRSPNSRQPLLSGPSQPFKRRRLCSDPAIELDGSLPSTSTDVSKSRFFASKKTQSPILKPATQRKKTKDAGINIWSDDSIEDVMADLPDVTEHPNKSAPKKIPVFEDGAEAGEKSAAKSDKWEDTPKLPHTQSAAHEDSQSSTSSNATNLSASTSATSIEASSQSLFQSVDKHVKAELAGLKETFSYPSKPESTPPLRNAGNLKVKPGEYQQALLASAKPQLPRTRSMTPLQRLGASALNRSQSFSGPVSDIESKQQTSVPKAGVPVPDDDNDQGQALRQKSVLESSTLSYSKGSEDLIIPDSEEEASGYSSASESETAEKQKSKLDLGKFAFSG